MQNSGVGRGLMRAVMDRASEHHAAGVRLVQAAFHNRSLSLYTSLGFDVREPLSCIQGHPRERKLPGCTVRTAQPSDAEACNTLSYQVHGFDRHMELEQAIQQNTAGVVERTGRITGYASALAFFVTQQRRAISTCRRSSLPRNTSPDPVSWCPRAMPPCSAGASQTASESCRL
jgi:hypothetical protein